MALQISKIPRNLQIFSPTIPLKYSVILLKGRERGVGLCLNTPAKYWMFKDIWSIKVRKVTEFCKYLSPEPPQKYSIIILKGKKRGAGLLSNSGGVSTKRLCYFVKRKEKQGGTGLLSSPWAVSSQILCYLVKKEDKGGGGGGWFAFVFLSYFQ